MVFHVPPSRSEGGEDRKFEDPDSGTYQAVIGGWWHIGYQHFEGGKYPPKKEVAVAFEIDERDTRGKRFVVYGRYTLKNSAVSEKSKASNLRLLCDAALPGHDNENHMDLDKLIGANVLVSVVKEEGKPAKPKGVSPLMRNMVALKVEGTFSPTEPIGLAKFWASKQITEARAKEITARFAEKAAEKADIAKARSGPGDEGRPEGGQAAVVGHDEYGNPAYEG